MKKNSGVEKPGNVHHGVDIGVHVTCMNVEGRRLVHLKFVYMQHYSNFHSDLNCLINNTVTYAATKL